MLGITTKTQAKSTEKLSSGYKINRAADDAAGLAISEKMRKQIRGLTQASLNAQDGISAVQTAEGALTEVHDMLQRMNELAIKSSNGTMSTDDRQKIQDEIDQLVDEIDRVSNTTKFNETYLLQGDATKSTTITRVTYTVPDATVTASGSTAYGLGSGNTVTTANAGDYVEVVNGELKYKSGVVLYKQDGVTTAAGSQYSGQVIAEKDLGNYFVMQQPGIYTDAAGKNLASAEDVQKTFADGQFTKQLWYKTADGTIKELGADFAAATGITSTSTVAGGLKLSFQVGADTTQPNKITITLDSMSAASLGIDSLKGDGVSGKDSTNPDAAVGTIAVAIDKVSRQRAALGAVQNRLEHTINNLDNIVENTTAAEAQIRDTDMATEMVKYSNNNILAQAGQAMLAQSNQSNQGVLSLLG